MEKKFKAIRIYDTDSAKKLNLREAIELIIYTIFIFLASGTFFYYFFGG